MAGLPVIIQSGKHGLDAAEVYYKNFPMEPSPAGDLDLQKAKFTLLPKISFNQLVVELTKVGTGGTALVVCHAHNEFGSVLASSGLLMPLADDSGSPALDDQFQFLLDALATTRKAKTIRAMPETTDKEKQAKSDKWVGLVTNFRLGFPRDGAPPKEIDKFFEKGLDERARNELKLQNGAASLKKMLANIEKLQSQRLERVEFRACNIGKDAPTLGHLKELLGCGKLLAPAAKTFYLPHMPVDTLKQFNDRFFSTHREKQFKRPGHTGKSGPDPGDVFIDVIRKHPTARVFWDVEYGFIAPNTSTIKLKDHVFAMIVEQVNVGWYSGSAATFHEDKKHKPLANDASKFVEQYIMKQGGNFSSSEISISGLWVEDGDPPWLLPSEPEYVDLIKQV